MTHPERKVGGNFGLSCAGLASEKTRAKVDPRREFYGCPFQYLNAPQLEDLLGHSGVRTREVSDPIIEMAKVQKSYGMACTMHFTAVHGEPDRDLFPEPHKTPHEFTWRAIVSHLRLKGQ
jgi:hypothetical protein